jgi:predicted molibdopterin-dependent oxidoreductase YjgC
MRDKGVRFVKRDADGRRSRHRRRRSNGWRSGPNTDAAMILALCHVLLTENLHDPGFLDPLHRRASTVRALPRRQDARMG